MECQPRAVMAKPGSPAWWLRLLTAILFVVYINYLHYHLLSETHFDGVHAVCPDDDDHETGVEQGDHHDSDRHKPHAATDHQLQMVAKHSTPLLAIYFLASQTSLSITRPQSLVVRALDERLKPPGESPPNPFQPRAPPLV
jgi:hypothetical protein